MAFNGLKLGDCVTYQSANICQVVGLSKTTTHVTLLDTCTGEIIEALAEKCVK